VLIGGDDFRIYRVQFDTGVFDKLLQKALSFWDTHIHPGVAPEIDGSSGADAWLKTKFPENTNEIRDADTVDLTYAIEYREVRERYEAVKKERHELENKLKERIGSSDGIQGDFGKFTWKKQKDSKKVDWEGVTGALAALLHENGLDPKSIAECVERHTTIKKGPRRFVAAFKP
jgi:predicted phage-related endonuclease